MEYPSVVKIFATTQHPNWACPWQSQSPAHGTGSGVIIAGGRVLTGAHVVANATFLQVQKLASPDKVTAEVEAVCHDADLALLRVTEPEFTEGVEPAEIGDLPSLRDRVSVVGFPVGGEEMSITEGVVSRIEVQEYSHSQRHLLAVTVDAAINEGNSGGPVFRDGSVCGLAFQVLRDAENIGEVVPAPLIRKFLAAIDRGISTAVPGLGMRVQKLENPMLRKSLGLGPTQSGLLVTELAYGNSAWGHLEVGDVITEMGGHRVANNGTVTYRGQYRTEYPVVLGDYHVGDTLECKVLRGGEEKSVELTLLEYRLLVPLSLYETIPSYYVYGGLVFQTLTRDFLRCWDEWWDRAPKEFLFDYYFSLPTEVREEIVILTRTLPDKVNVGYEDSYNLSVAKVNGVRPRNMREFVRELERAGETVELEMSTGTRIVLDAQAALAANPTILERYRVRAQCSPDLQGL